MLFSCQSSRFYGFSLFPSGSIDLQADDMARGIPVQLVLLQHSGPCSLSGEVFLVCLVGEGRLCFQASAIL